jgi:hypothetical protein
MSTQSAQTDETALEQGRKLGRQSGRGDTGYTLLLERMTVEQWDAFLDGETTADELRAQLLDDGTGGDAE